MLNYIWFGMLVLGFIVGILCGRVREVTAAVIESSGDAIKFSISLTGIMCLWLGLMEIGKKSGLIRKIALVVRPLLKFLFPGIPKNHPSAEAVVMNIIANILGLGNASTPLGLKAMGELQKLNLCKNTLSNEMSMFLVLNAASLQLVPTTVIAIRAHAGSANPVQIIGAVWVTSAISVITGIVSIKILSRLQLKRWFC